MTVTAGASTDRTTVTPLRVACVIASLRTGGAERVLAGLAGELAAHGHRVEILTLMEPGEAPFYPVSPDVGVATLGGLGTAASLGRPDHLLRAAWRVRRALVTRRPDVVLGFTTTGNMLALLASQGSGLPVIAAERIDPGAHAQRIGRVRAAFRDHLYARTRHVVVQTTRARRGLPWLPDHRISRIANPVPAIAGRAAPDHPAANGRFRLLGIGRLDRQKGFDLLVPAFARLAPRYPDWDLVIHGDGPERGALEAVAGDHLAAGRVALPGATRDIETALVGAHALAFPSRYEGFPNALAEAMAAGLPAVGFADVSGVEDLILSEPHAAATGLLADAAMTVDSLADQLALLMGDSALRARLGDNARQHVAAFTPQIHYEQWERLLSRVARSHSKS